MRYISASGMRSEAVSGEWRTVKGEGSNRISFMIFLAACCLLAAPVYAELLDRVAAIVDDEVVLMSEVDKEYGRALNYGIEVTRAEVLEGLVNRVLLLREARRINREHIFSVRSAEDNNALITEYIETRLKAFIRIPHEELELFYTRNREYFSEDFYDVRDEIEAYLVEREVNKKLSAHLKELREKSYIKIQLSD